MQIRIATQRLIVGENSMLKFKMGKKKAEPGFRIKRF
jgi:hypothetical protein